MMTTHFPKSHMQPEHAAAGAHPAYAGGGSLYPNQLPEVSATSEGPVKPPARANAVTSRLKERSPARLWGKSLPDRILEKQEEALKKQVQKEKEADAARHGVEHDRNNPIPGSTVIVSDEDIGEMEDVLISNGLPNFEARTALNITCKTLDAIPEILVPPVDSLQGVVHDPERSTAELEVNIMDLVFPARDGSIPQKFVQSVLNGLNPAMTVRLIQKDIKEHIARAFSPENVKWVGNMIASVAMGWAKKIAPADQGTLEEFVTEGILHEYSHGLILALPAGDMPAGREDLGKLTLENYINLVFGEPGRHLHTSVAMFKNVLKALRALRNSTPSEATRENFLRISAIEMFCDRFGMYLYENHRKNIAYRDVLGTMKNSEFANCSKVDAAEQARAEGTLGAYLQSQGARITEDQLPELEKRLQDAERAHVYTAKYGDAVIGPAERDFYSKVLTLFRHYDKEDAISTFTPRHVATSTAIHMLPMLSGAHLGVGTTAPLDRSSEGTSLSTGTTAMEDPTRLLANANLGIVTAATEE